MLSLILTHVSYLSISKCFMKSIITVYLIIKKQICWYCWLSIIRTLHVSLHDKLNTKIQTPLWWCLFFEEQLLWGQITSLYFCFLFGFAFCFMSDNFASWSPINDSSTTIKYTVNRDMKIQSWVHRFLDVTAIPKKESLIS